jgi:tryptophan-rich sensory protein
MDYQKTYTTYKRPPLSPPPYLFGIVWPVLYVLIAISYVFTFYQAAKANIPATLVIPFIINLVANGLFTYFQFKLKNNFYAALDIIIVLTTIILTMILIWPYYHWVAYFQIPYLAWVTFATYLQLAVTILNRKNK